jgi:hypothetical protein
MHTVAGRVARGNREREELPMLVATIIILGVPGILFLLASETASAAFGHRVTGDPELQAELDRYHASR